MPKSSAEKLEYMTNYENTPQQVKVREERNKARADAIKAGTVKKGDGKEVDHIKMLDQGGTNAKSNRRVVPAAKNRAWRKTTPKAYGK